MISCLAARLTPIWRSIFTRAWTWKSCSRLAVKDFRGERYRRLGIYVYVSLFYLLPLFHPVLRNDAGEDVTHAREIPDFQGILIIEQVGLLELLLFKNFPDLAPVHNFETILHELDTECVRDLDPAVPVNAGWRVKRHDADLGVVGDNEILPDESRGLAPTKDDRENKRCTPHVTEFPPIFVLAPTIEPATPVLDTYEVP